MSPATHLSLLAPNTPLLGQSLSSELRGSSSGRQGTLDTLSSFCRGWGGGCLSPQTHCSHLCSLFEAVYALIKNRIHRLPVLDPVSGAVLHILTHKRLLKFLHIFVSLGTASGCPEGLRSHWPNRLGRECWECSGGCRSLTPTCPQPAQGSLLPQPSFLSRTIQDLGIGTFRDLAVVLDTAPILTALDIFVDRRVSALPVVNEAGTWTQKWGWQGWSCGRQGISSGSRVELEVCLLWVLDLLLSLSVPQSPHL